MNQATLNRCEMLIQYRDQLKNVFRWEDGRIHLACASLLMMKERPVDESALLSVKAMLKQRLSTFSYFRGTAQPIIVTMLAASDDPEKTLDDAIEVYELLKMEFAGSEFLPLAALNIAQHAKPEDFQTVAHRARDIYRQMRSLHPLLTSSEDSALCAMLAMSDKLDGELVDECERCYQYLKPSFSSGDSVQTLSFVLTLMDGPVEEKCSRVTQLYQRLRGAGLKYGKYYELASLGVLAMYSSDAEQLIAEMTQIDDWLTKQKGFGFFSGVTDQQRLMYAGMIARKEQENGTLFQAAAVESAIAITLAQETAMMACVAASTVLVVSSNSSH